MVFQHPEEQSIVGVNGITTYGKEQINTHSSYYELYHGSYLRLLQSSSKYQNINIEVKISKNEK